MDRADVIYQDFQKAFGSYHNTGKLQDDLDKLVKWSEKWQMVFNLSAFRS